MFYSCYLPCLIRGNFLLPSELLVICTLFYRCGFFLSMVFYFRYLEDSLKIKIQKYISYSINLGIDIVDAINTDILYII